MQSANVTAGNNGKATEYNNLRNDIVLGDKIIGTDTDGSTVTFDLSVATKGNIRQVTLGGNRTLAVTNAVAGQVFIIQLIQDGTGSRTVTWFAGISWGGGSAPTLTTTLNKTDCFGFICTGTNTYQGYILGMNI
jgi:hypothetical protein